MPTSARQKRLAGYSRPPAKERDITLAELVSEIDADRQQANLSSALRVFVLDHFKAGAARGGRSA